MINYGQKVLNELIKIEREGTGDLINFLKGTDFFQAPASSKFHLDYEGGLVEHSWNVFQILKKKVKEYKLNINEDTIRVCALLHDVCKIDYYRKKSVFSPGENQWEIDHKFPVGHGEKSVIVIQRYMNLTDEEVLAIRWHMVAFDAGIHFGYPTGYSFRDALKKTPLIVALFTSDYEASELIEKRKVK